MATVKDILGRKGREVYRVARGATVFRAIEVMTKKNVGSLLVMDGGEVCGIVTERDYLREIAIKGRSSRETEVGEIMTASVCCAQEEDSVERCLAMMTELHCRHLPIMGAEGLVGLVSIGDLVKQMVHDQRTEIRYLRDYIQGRYPG